MTFKPSAPNSLSNHEWLVERFARRVARHVPKSLLDVGCGSGLLLRTLARGGAECTGIDRAGPRLEALREEGLKVREGSAYELPFADAAMEWVTLRHIPHHLEDPPRAFREALRVARCGVLVAEPWFDVTVPSQAAALRYDQFEKSLDRRGGSYHAESLSLNDLLSAFPNDLEESWNIEAFTDLRLRERDLELALEELGSRVTSLAADDSARSEFAAVIEQGRRDGLSYNGSLCLMLLKPEASAGHEPLRRP